MDKFREFVDMEIELKSWDKGNITFLTFFFENLGKGVYDFLLQIQDLVMKCSRECLIWQW